MTTPTVARRVKKLINRVEDLVPESLSGLAAAHPDLVKNWIRAHIELSDWINAHPADAKKLLNEQIQRETNKSLPAEVLNEAFSRLQVTYDPLHTALKTAAMSSSDLIPGAYKQSAPASAYAVSRAIVSLRSGRPLMKPSERPVRTTPVPL